jgi:hypothetical protein
MDCHLKSRVCRGEILPIAMGDDATEFVGSCDFHRDRVGCCVPYCNRSFKREHHGEYRVCCGTHWRMADKDLRRLFSTLRKRGERHGWTHARILANNRLYDRIVASAIENLMGVDHGKLD